MSEARRSLGSVRVSAKNQKKIVEYLRAQPEGVWSSTHEILKATGLSRGQFYRAARALDDHEIIDARRDPYRGSANLYMLRQRSLGWKGV